MQSIEKVRNLTSDWQGKSQVLQLLGSMEQYTFALKCSSGKNQVKSPRYYNFLSFIGFMPVHLFLTLFLFFKVNLNYRRHFTKYLLICYPTCPQLCAPPSPFHYLVFQETKFCTPTQFLRLLCFPKCTLIFSPSHGCTLRF